MRYVLSVVAVLVAGVTVGALLQDDPGVVVIGYHGVAVRMSLAKFALFLIVVMGLVYLLVRLAVRLLRARRALARWRVSRRERRAVLGLEQGLRALAAGEWRNAERLLSQGGRVARTPLLHYLGAARAAHALAAADRRDAYLRLAADSTADELAVELARAEFLLDSGAGDEARAVLERLSRSAPDNARVLQLEAAVLERAADWDGLLRLLPRLARRRVVDHASLDRLERTATFGMLNAARGQAQPVDPDGAWSRVPRHLRDEPAVIVAHSRNLMAAGRGAVAEQLLRRHISRAWDAGLVAEYGRIHGADDTAQLGTAERWLVDRPQDADLLLTLGRLSHRIGLWGKARSYLEVALKCGAEPAAYALLVDALQRMGDVEAAARYTLEGLRHTLGQEQAALLPAPAR